MNGQDHDDVRDVNDANHAPHEQVRFPTDEYRNAEDIPIHSLELTLLLPVFVQAKRKHRDDYVEYVEPTHDPSRHDFLNHWVAFLTRDSEWKPVNRAYPAHNESAYSEFCYFHPFVRNFLYLTRDDIRATYSSNKSDLDQKRAIYPSSREFLKEELIDGQATNRNLRILERNDLLQWTVEVQELTSRFDIESCWLYLFDTQVAMLELQLKHACSSFGEKPLPGLYLNHVLSLHDAIRRVYAPYWRVHEPKGAKGSIAHECGHVPTRVTLVRKTGETIDEIRSSFGNYQTFEARAKERIGQYPSGPWTDVEGLHTAAVDQHLDHVAVHREPYTVEVWRELLRPLVPTTLDLPEESESASPCLRYEQIQDDRATLLSHIAVGDPSAGNKDVPDVRRIKLGDWLRLAAIDDPGDSDRYPYSPTFFDDPENPLKGLAYDRFWHPTGKKPGHEKYHTTRWLCSGYGFCGVGDAADTGFFMDDHSGALCHFRRHYFALGLIAQFHRSSLLLYKHRLAEAADAMLADDSKYGASEGADRLRDVDFRESAEQLAKEIMRFRTLYWFSEVSNQMQGIELFAMYREHLRLDQLFADVTGDVDAAVDLLRQWDAEEQARATQLLSILGAILIVVTPFLEQLGDLTEGRQLSGVLYAMLFLLGLVLLCLRCPTSWLRRRRSMCSGARAAKTDSSTATDARRPAKSIAKMEERFYLWWGSRCRWCVRRPRWVKLGAGLVAVIIGFAGIVWSTWPERKDNQGGDSVERTISGSPSAWDGIAAEDEPASETALAQPPSGGSAVDSQLTVLSAAAPAASSAKLPTTPAPANGM